MGRSYKDTRVSVDQTQGAIRRMLQYHNAKGVQFREDWAANTLGFSFIHAKKTETAEIPMIVHMHIQIWPKGKKPWDATESSRQQRERQVWRALYWYLKAQLEAVEFGLRTFEDAFLADVVVQDGRTVGDVIREGLVEGKMRLALPSPTGDPVPA
jgi:hypothetical protein